MKLYIKKFAASFCILFVSVTVSVGQNKPTVLTELEIVGNWQVNVGASIEQDGKIRNISSFVTIEQPTRIQVTDELYENLRQYDSEGGGWSNGFALRGVEASGCSHYDGLWPETVEVRTAANNGGILLKRGLDYQFEPRWGVIGALPEGQISSTDKIYISYVHTPQRVDSIILSVAGEIIVRKGIPASSLPQIPELQQDEILLANIYFDHRETTLVDENLFPLMGEISEGQVTPTAKRYLPKTLAKLRSGEKLRVLAWGDSVTAGAYLPANLRWPQQFVEQLKERFPRADIELVVEAWGGYSTQMYMLEPPESDLNYEKKVVSVKPDLIVMEFVNDAAMDMESLYGTYERILSDMRSMGTEMLILTPHYIRPDWMGFASQKYIDEDPRPYVKFLHEFTSCNKIALADGSAGFGELWRRGIPYNIMMANCINHPDERGMQIFVDALMAVFPINFVTNSNPADFWGLTPNPNSLILEGSSTLLGKSSTDPATTYGFGGYEQLNNGTFSPSASGQALTEATYQITYILDTSVNTRGYDLASLRSIAYYGDAARADHVYEVWIGYVGGAVGIDVFLGSVYWDASATTNPTTVVDATFDVAASATGVDVIKFKISNINVGDAYTALEVAGTATPPQVTVIIMQ